MKILGVGVDIVENSRIKKSLKNNLFIKRIFTTSEITTAKKIKQCCKLAKFLDLEVHAGHGLDYKTTKLLSNIKEIKEFNIGHFIIGESIIYGLKNIINKFKKISNN